MNKIELLDQINKANISDDELFASCHLYFKHNSVLYLELNELNYIINNKKEFIFKFFYEQGYLFISQAKVQDGITNPYLLSDTYDFVFHFSLAFYSFDELYNDDILFLKTLNIENFKTISFLKNKSKIVQKRAIVYFLKENIYKKNQYMSKVYKIAKKLNLLDFLAICVDEPTLSVKYINSNLLFQHFVENKDLHFFSISIILRKMKKFYPSFQDIIFDYLDTKFNEPFLEYNSQSSINHFLFNESINNFSSYYFENMLKKIFLLILNTKNNDNLNLFINDFFFLLANKLTNNKRLSPDFKAFTSDSILDIFLQLFSEANFNFNFILSDGFLFNNNCKHSFEQDVILKLFNAFFNVPSLKPYFIEAEDSINLEYRSLIMFENF